MKSLRFSLLTGAIFAALPLAAQAQTPSAPAPITSDTAAPEGARAENAATPPASEQAPDYSGNLTGNWGGYRTKLAAHGVLLAAIYHADFFRNFSGGIKTGNAFLDDLDLQLSIDGEKLLGVPGLSAFIYGLNTDGSKVNANLVGSAGGIDSIETVKNRPKLYEAWVQQNFFDDKISILGGLYDVNTEFEETDASLLFINPTYGASTELGTTGKNGPSVFPTTSAGGRLLVKPIQDVYVEGAVLGGNPADPGDPNGDRFGYGPDAHLFLIAEAGYKNTENGHYALGAWRYTGGLEDFTATTPAGDPVRKGDAGAYLLAERTVWTDAADKDRKLAAFVRAGVTDADTSPYRFAWSAGINMARVLPKRPDSQFGLAVSQAGIGDHFRRSMIAGGDNPDHVETQFEATYADKPLPWFTVQPDLQYTLHPLADAAADNAWTGGVRLVVNF